MMNTMISQYVRTMFDESRDGELTVGDVDDRFEMPVEWDEETANTLAQQCGTLIAHLTELSGQYEKLKTETRHLTQEQLDVWNTYLKPFPPHGLDMNALRQIWEKFDAYADVTPEEMELADAWTNWFEENAMKRLPTKNCTPIPLMNRAKRYCRLVQLEAPTVVLEEEAMRFAEEFVLYHCQKRKCLK